MTDTYADLRALAEAATKAYPDEWGYDADNNGELINVWRCREGDYDSEPIATAMDESVALFLLACHRRVPALLADLDAAQGAATEWRESYQECSRRSQRTIEINGDLIGERDALAAKVEALTAEVGRLTGSLAQSKRATEKARERLSRMRSDGTP